MIVGGGSGGGGAGSGCGIGSGSVIGIGSGSESGNGSGSVCGGCGGSGGDGAGISTPATSMTVTGPGRGGAGFTFGSKKPNSFRKKLAITGPLRGDRLRVDDVARTENVHQQKMRDRGDAKADEPSVVAEGTQRRHEQTDPRCRAAEERG